MIQINSTLSLVPTRAPAGGGCAWRWAPEIKSPMKLALLILCITNSLIAADLVPARKHKPYFSKFESEETQLDGYSPSESPWKDNKKNSDFEWHLVSLMRVEARLWGLQYYLESQGEEAHYTTDRASQIIHSEVLSGADKALALLKRTPTRPLTQLLIHHLEMYPYDWVEVGWEDLLPGLRKLLATPSKKSKHPER